MAGDREKCLTAKMDGKYECLIFCTHSVQYWLIYAFLDYVSKPLTIPQLVVALDRLLQNCKQHQQQRSKNVIFLFTQPCNLTTV
jgi:two-component SAPR family response regulator